MKLQFPVYATSLTQQKALFQSVCRSQTHLKHKHMSPSGHGADQDRVEDLIVLFALC